VYILFSNRVGFEDGINFWGGSNITSPTGEMLSSAKLLEEDLIATELDSTEVQRARRFSRHVLDERPELVLDILRRQLKRK
jgi:predicted amidohydrolase